jgi:MYXO-CTERM domain-containing protein
MRHTLILPNVFAVCGGAVILVACAVPTPDNTEGRRSNASSIIGGTASSNPDDDSVVLLPMPGSFCTGTLIAPNLVLTARHCVSEPGAGQAACEPFGADKAPSSIGVALGEHPSSAAVVARGTKLFLETTSSVCGQDIALLLLDKDVPGVKPKKVRLTPPVVGEKTTAIGYGQDETQQMRGRLIRSSIAIEAVGPTTRTASANGQTINVSVPANDFMTGESVCHGDSGGPLFDAQGQVLGTTSRGTPAGCVAAPALFSSTAGHAELIKTALKASGHPLDAAAPDAGADASTPPPSGNGGGTTEAGGGGGGGGGAPTGPTPGSTEEGKPADENTDHETSTGGGGGGDGDKKKSKGSADDEEESPKPSRRAVPFNNDDPAAASGCSSTSATRRDTSGFGILLVLGVVIAFARRRRRS